MKNFYQTILCALLCLAIVGNAACTSMYTIDASAATVAEHSIKHGDKVHLRFADLTQKTITVTAVDESGISGHDTHGDEVTARYEELDAVIFEGIDGGKTAKNAGKAVGVAALIAVVVAAVGVAAAGELMTYK